MEHRLAVDFIRDAVDRSLQTWADLGAGDGTFTLALAEVLGADHSIVAFDSDSRAMQSIPAQYNGTEIRRITADFASYRFRPSEFDGIIIANALHFIPNKQSVMNSLKVALSSGGRIVLIEYDTTKSSEWIPHPLNFDALRAMALAIGFEKCLKIRETKSRYGNWNMYSALIQ